MTEAVILAGGPGTRLRSAVPNLPKAMAPVAGRPFLEVVLCSLRRKGFRRVIVALGYLANTVVAHFGPRFAGMELRYEIEDTPLGTGGALRLALAQCRNDHAFVFNGDTFLDLEVAAVEALWNARHVPVIVACQVSDTTRYGRLTVCHGQIVGFSATGRSGPGLISAGCYVAPTDLLDEFAPGQPFSLEADFLVRAVCERRFAAFVSRGRFIDIGTPEEYARAQTDFAGTHL